MDPKLKLIAVYLPQFHTIPENDEWWGKGFTEWTNVKPAIPYFEGHYQPHEPTDELGYYDLFDVTVMEKQAQLAKAYGIHGFAYYYYWFNGKTLLEKPLQQMLANPKVDIPFCLTWANHNWTRSWDGGNTEIILEQFYEEGFYARFIDDLIPYFQDNRYIKIENKPVLIIHQPHHIKNPRKTISDFRKYAKEKYNLELYLIHSQNTQEIPPGKFGYDAALAECPNYKAERIELSKKERPVVAKEVKIRLFDYVTNAFQYILRKEQRYKLFRCCYPMWDNTPRRKKKNGWVFLGSTPQNFKNFLIEMSKITVQDFAEKERFVFIDAWNEWAEGTHLEPCKKYGYQYLEACREVFEMSLEVLLKSGFDKKIRNVMQRKIFMKEFIYNLSLGKVYFFRAIDKINYYIYKFTKR